MSPRMRRARTITAWALLAAHLPALREWVTSGQPCD